MGLDGLGEAMIRSRARAWRAAGAGVGDAVAYKVVLVCWFVCLCYLVYLSCGSLEGSTEMLEVRPRCLSFEHSKGMSRDRPRFLHLENLILKRWALNLPRTSTDNSPSPLSGESKVRYKE